MIRFIHNLLFLAVLIVAGLVSIAAAADLPVGNLLAEGRVDDAITALQQRIKTAPKDAQSYNLLCRAYYALGQWDQGVSACERAVSLDPGNSQYHLWLGRVYGEKADHAGFLSAAHMAGKVRTEFETAVGLDPASVEARADLADFYLQAPGVVGGGKDKAEGQAQEIAKLDPAQGHGLKARIAEKKKDYVRAENEYRGAIESSGGQGGTWLNLARFYQRTGRFTQMEDALHHATAPEMNRPDLLVPAAELLINSRRNPADAAQLLRRYTSSAATVEDAPLFKAHYLLGTLLEQQGDKQGAVDEYRAALSLAHNFSLAQNALHRLQGQPTLGANLN